MTDARKPYACLDCKHLRLVGATPDWSDITPGDPMEWCCRKGHYYIDNDDLNAARVKSVLELGSTCTDYDEKESQQ